MPDAPRDVAPTTLTVTLNNGEQLVLHEPSYLDLADAEQEIGQPFHKWQDATSGLNAIAVMFWACARKHGVSEERQIRGEYPVSLRQFMLKLHPADVVKHGSAVKELFTRAFGAGDPEPPSSEPADSASEAGAMS
ncbi:MAG: hypothetical protein ACE5FA_00005 [Dehalococcoidia bacterium]